MILIPAIDLKDGKCVRLRQGRITESTVFSDDPVAMASHWKAQGGRRLHIVDLDGAFAGMPRNGDLIREMVAEMGDIPVQVGGGIRSEGIAERYLEMGVSAVILGTRAVEDPDFLTALAERFPNRVLLGLDARDGQVATRGWDADSGTDAIEFAKGCSALPLAGIVYTDIQRDGMLTGVNVSATLALATAANLPVVASGGVTKTEDLQALRAAFEDDKGLLLGAITGRAIYEGTLDLGEGQAVFDL